MKKYINLKHHCEDYECMWNGIEDMYMEKTNEKLPYKYFFLLASSNSFCYIKTEKDQLKRMIAFGDGRTKKMYEFLAPKIGFNYRFCEKNNYDKAFKGVKKEIDSNYPVVIGGLDMYYIPYFKKIYHNQHIPYHYVLVIGYDDDKEVFNILECGRNEVIQLSYNDIRLAWNCKCEGLSKPFTFIKIRWNDKINSKYEIARLAFKEKVNNFLHPECNVTGYKGFEKFINELPLLKNNLNKKDYDAILINLVNFFADVPTIPNAILGIEEKDFVNYYGGFDIMENVLTELGEENSNDAFIEAGKLFGQNCKLITEIKDIICDYITLKNDRTNELQSIFKNILDIMIKSNRILEKDLLE